MSSSTGHSGTSGTMLPLTGADDVAVLGADFKAANAAASSGCCSCRERSDCSVASSRAILTSWSGCRESPQACFSLREEICSRVNSTIERSKQYRVHHVKVGLTCASPSRLGCACHPTDWRTVAGVYCCSYCILDSKRHPMSLLTRLLFRCEFQCASNAGRRHEQRSYAARIHACTRAAAADASFIPCSIARNFCRSKSARRA